MNELIIQTFNEIFNLLYHPYILSKIDFHKDNARD